jgi:methionyl-tRNA formyltransferase
MKIIFFGTANVALPILEVLNKQHQVLAVVTPPDVKVGRKQELQDSPVSALAKDLKITTFKPEKVKGDDEFLSQLSALGADIFVVVAYGKILPLEIINLPQYKTINVHFSVLPKYRGPSPIQHTLLNGDAQTGTSIFILDEGIDNGLLLSQKIAGVDPDDNYFTLSDKLAKLSASIINQVIEDYASGKITPLPQDEERVTHTKIIAKEDGRIDWQKPAQEIYDQFRAFYIWPGIWTTWNGKTVKITDCIPYPDLRIESGSADNCGTVQQDGSVVCGGGTVLKIKQLQLEGKTETDINSFINGYRDFAGSKLGL